VAAAAAAAVGAAVALAVVAVAAAAAEAGGSIGSIGSSGGNSIRSSSGRGQQWWQQQWELRWHILQQQQRQRQWRRLPNCRGSRARPGWAGGVLRLYPCGLSFALVAWALPLRLSLCLITHCNDVGWWQWRWQGRKIYQIKKGRIFNNQMVALVNGSGNKLCRTKMGMVVGQCGQFWWLAAQMQRQERHGKKKIGMNGMDFFVFLCQ
jgi:hypothetical protein